MASNKAWILRRFINHGTKTSQIKVTNELKEG